MQPYSKQILETRLAALKAERDHVGKTVEHLRSNLARDEGKLSEIETSIADLEATLSQTAVSLDLGHLGDGQYNLGAYMSGLINIAGHFNHIGKVKNNDALRWLRANMSPEAKQAVTRLARYLDDSALDAS